MNEDELLQIAKAQTLGLLDDDWGPTDKFVELAEQAMDDINNDAQCRLEILELASQPEVILVSHLIPDKIMFRDTFIFTCAAKRMLDLVDVENKQLGVFLTTYLAFLQEQGVLKLKVMPRV